MKNGCSIVFLIILIILVIFLTSLLLDKKTTLEPEYLLINDPSWPTEWSTGEIPISSLNWEQTDHEMRSKKPAFDAESSAKRVWSNTSSSISIVQEVFQYNSPLKSSFQYWISRPETVYTNKWPNFSNPTHKNQRYPRSDFSLSSSADQSYPVCAMGTPDDCQLWYYWARYGQYLINVSFFAPNSGIDKYLFGDVVEDVDLFIARQFSN